jgi:hypothetical protein
MILLDREISFLANWFQAKIKSLFAILRAIQRVKKQKLKLWLLKKNKIMVRKYLPSQ